MSVVKIQATPTGTGTVTITAPTTNTDQTVTLPDQTGTLYISGGDIGTPSGGNGSNLTNLNASNLSTGTVGTARLASGTANSTTYLRGDQTWATVTSLPGSQGQVFTSSGTFTVPSGITAVKVTVAGGGGGGGSSRSPTCGVSQGGYGGGGGLAIKWITGLTPGGTVTVTVGAGGAGGTPNNAGSTGGTSSFGAYCSATGGGGGGHGFNGTGSQGSQGTATGGDLNFAAARYTLPNTTSYVGGPQMFGGAPTGNGNDTNGNPGINYGSGATGGITGGATSRTGGTGSGGLVIVEW